MITKKTKINNKAQKAKKTKKAKTALNDKNSEDCPGWPKIAKNFACQYILKNSVRNYFGKPCSSYHKYDEQKQLQLQNHVHHRGHYNSADELATSETVVGVKGAELPSKQDKSVICLLSHFSTLIFVRDK